MAVSLMGLLVLRAFRAARGFPSGFRPGRKTRSWPTRPPRTASST